MSVSIFVFCFFFLARIFFLSSDQVVQDFLFTPYVSSSLFAF